MTLKPTLLLSFFSNGEDSIGFATRYKDGKPMEQHLIDNSHAKEVSQMLGARQGKNSETSSPVRKKHQLICRRVLYYENSPFDHIVAWVLPEGVYTVINSNGKKKKIRYPNMVMIFRNYGLYTYLLISDEIDDLKVSSVSYSNVTDGHVCLGNIKRKDSKEMSLGEVIDNYEDYYFNTKFTSDIVNDRRTGFLKFRNVKNPVLLKKIIDGK